MPTIIDSLVVSLGFDTKGLTDGGKQAGDVLKRTKDQAHAAAKQIEADGKVAASFFSKMKSEALSFFAVVLGTYGLAEFTRRTLDGNAAISRLSRNLGVSTETLSTWEGAVKQVGGTAQDAAQGIQSLVTAREQIELTGQSNLIPYLQLLGLSLNDLKDPAETLLKIADAFHKMDPARAQAIGAGLGFSPAFVNLLELGRSGVQDKLKTSVHLTREQAQEAENAQNALGLMGEAAQSLGNILLSDLFPAISKAAEGIRALETGDFTNAPWAKALVPTSQEAAELAHGLEAVERVLHDLTGGDQGLQLVTPEDVKELSELVGLFGNLLNYVDDVVQLWNSLLHGDVSGAAKWAHQASLDLFHKPGGAGEAAGSAGASGSAVGAALGASGFSGNIWANGRSGAGTGLSGMVESYFQAHGYTAEQARGIAAGITAEGGSPEAFNGAGGGQGAYGIGQWRGARLAELRRRYGQHPTMQQQLDFLLWELNGGDSGGAAVRRQSTARGTSRAYIDAVMRPGAGAAGDYRRADRYLARAGPTPGIAARAAAPASSNNTTHIGTVVVNTQATDARGIARDIHSELTAQANTGLM